MFLAINAMCIDLKIQHFQGVRQNKEIVDLKHQIKNICDDLVGISI